MLGVVLTLTTISRPKLDTIIEAQSLQEWQSAFLETEKYGICGVKLETTGQDPLSHQIKLISLALPNNTVYIADGLIVIRISFYNSYYLI
jgi:hypothetical protein